MHGRRATVFRPQCLITRCFISRGLSLRFLFKSGIVNSEESPFTSQPPGTEPFVGPKSARTWDKTLRSNCWRLTPRVRAGRSVRGDSRREDSCRRGCRQESCGGGSCCPDGCCRLCRKGHCLLGSSRREDSYRRGCRQSCGGGSCCPEGCCRLCRLSPEKGCCQESHRLRGSLASCCQAGRRREG